MSAPRRPSAAQHRRLTIGLGNGASSIPPPATSPSPGSPDPGLARSEPGSAPSPYRRSPPRPFCDRARTLNVPHALAEVHPGLQLERLIGPGQGIAGRRTRNFRRQRHRYGRGRGNPPLRLRTVLPVPPPSSTMARICWSSSSAGSFGAGSSSPPTRKVNSKWSLSTKPPAPQRTAGR